MTTGMQNLSVTRTITVRAPRTRAFAVFTEKFVTWWPSSHTSVTPRWPTR
jgi:hypothetical protein